MILRTLASLKSPAGQRGCLSTLIFHRVLPAQDALFPGEPDARVFDAILHWVGANFNVVPLDSAVHDIANGCLPERALSISFDDGYADNHDVALPLLLKHRMTATFFVSSAFIDGGRMWNDTVIEAIRGMAGEEIDLSDLGLGIHRVRTVEERRSAIEHLLSQLKYRPLAERTALVGRVAARSGTSLPNDLMMSSSQLRALQDAGMAIGGHTASHPILASLNDEDAFAEIREGKQRIESVIGEKLKLFAFPNGKPGRDYRKVHVEMVRTLGFVGAVSTAAGVARAGCDLYQIPRFTPWDRSRWKFNFRLLRNMDTKVELAQT